MKTLRHLSAMMLIVCCCNVAANAGDDALRSILTARYAAMKAAMASRDAAAIAAIFTPDAISVDASCQSENRDQMVSEVAKLPIDLNKQSNTTIVAVKRSGDTAIVQQQYDMSTTKSAQDGSARSVKLHAESTDTWVLVHGTWLAKRTVTNLMDLQINGAAVAHKIRPDSSGIVRLECGNAYRVAPNHSCRK